MHTIRNLSFAFFCTQCQFYSFFVPFFYHLIEYIIQFLLCYTSSLKRERERENKNNHTYCTYHEEKLAVDCECLKPIRTFNDNHGISVCISFRINNVKTIVFHFGVNAKFLHLPLFDIATSYYIESAIMLFA